MVFETANSTPLLEMKTVETKTVEPNCFDNLYFTRMLVANLVDN